VLSKARDYLILLGIAGLVVGLDQWAKYMVRMKLAIGETWSPTEWLGQFIRIVHWNNTGAAFGLFPEGGLVFTVVAIVVSVAILYYYPQVPSSKRALRFALALQLGGALGNLTSRLMHGTVTDFISVGTFPVFNVADSSISIGVAILVGTMWIEERRGKTEQIDASPAEVEEGDGSPEVEPPIV
jgi:signal peptidase II